MSDKEYRAEQIAREAAKRLDEVRAGSSKSELLPCPFCGGEAEILTAESMHGGYLSGIMCNDCRSRGDVYVTEAEAIEAWNNRIETVTVTAGITTVTDTPQITYVPERTCKRITLGLEREREIATVSWICSACGKHMNSDHNYCPNCGAKVVDA